MALRLPKDSFALPFILEHLLSRYSWPRASFSQSRVLPFSFDIPISVLYLVSSHFLAKLARLWLEV